MTKVIKSLTKEQTDRFPEFVDKWNTIGFSTEPLDLKNSIKAVKLIYETAGLPNPTKFHVADSPVAAIKLIKELDPSKNEQEIFSEMSFGNHEATWLSFYNYCQEVLELDVCNKLQGFMDLAKYCGWVSFYEDTVVFQHRPESIKLDDQNRLHSENGPAIRFRDGVSIYSWHGVRIPADWIENKANLSAETALTWENIEQRRAACEILGWAKILDKLDAKVIDENEDEQIGTLLSVNIPDIGRENFLKVRCGTGRIFAIPVPPNMKTAEEANAWTFDLPVVDFKKLEIRT